MGERALVLSPGSATGGVHFVYSRDALTARLLGEADLVTESLLRQILAGALNAAAEPSGRPGTPLRLVLDLSELSFCDVRCIEVLSDTVVRGRSAGVPVSVTGASSTLERVWGLLGCEPPLASCQGSDLPSAGPWQEPAAADTALSTPAGPRRRVSILRRGPRPR